MQYFYDQLLNETRLLTFFLVVIRTGGILFTAPVFSSMSIKPQIRMAITLAVATVLAPFVPPVPFTADVPTLYLIIQIFKELLIGICIGTLTSTLFTGVQMGGYLLDFQMGFSMVNVMDPETGGQFSFMSQVVNIILILVFIAIGGPRLIIMSIQYSYTLLPTGSFDFNSSAFMFAISLFIKVFIVSVTLLAPPLITLMAANAVMGVLGKLIPQINLMVVGFPIKIAVGMIMFIFSLHFFYVAFEKIATSYFRYIQDFMRLVSF